MIKQLLLSAAVATMTISATAQTNLPMVAEAVEGVSSELQEANQAAYEQVLAQIEALQAQYEEAKAEIAEVNPNFDFEEGGWNEIGVMLETAKNGAAQALESANEDGEAFQFPYGAEDIEASIAEMKKTAFADYNKAAYNDVVDNINELLAEYDAACGALIEQYPGINLSEWADIILRQLDEAKAGANQALAAANEYGEKFVFPFDPEYYQGMIAEMQKAAPNQAKYDALMAQIDAVNAHFKEVVASLEAEYPGINLSEWQEIINEQIAQARTGAKQALDVAIEDGEEFNFVFSTEDIDAAIAQMEQSAPNQAAYDKVMAEINAVEVDYEKAKAEIAELDPEFDFADWNEIIGGQIAQAKTGAEQELANVNEEGGEYTFAFGAEDILGMIAEMKKAGVMAYNQKAYAEVMTQIDAVEADYNNAVASIKESNPDFDLAEWEDIIAPLIADAKIGAEQALAAANEDGVKYTFAFGAEDIKNIITEMNYTAYPYLKAYDEVMAQINAVDVQYNEAKEEIAEVNPEFDFADWNEIIDSQIALAKTGAEAAYENAKDGETDGFDFSFDTEDIENSIAEMKKAGFAAYNQEALDKVLAEINDVEAQYEEAKAEIAEVNPEFDFEAEEWAELSKMIEDAKVGAEKAYAAANDYGEKFNFPFGAEDIENYIAEMKKAGFEAYNQKAYDEVIDQINALIADYNTAIDEIRVSYPEYDLTEWEEIIGGQLEMAKNGAQQALDAATEDGEKFFFPFDAEEYNGMIAQMESDAKDFSGIANIEAEVAAGNAKIYTLDGKAHFAPVRGQVNVIVRGNSTVKVMIK